MKQAVGKWLGETFHRQGVVEGGREPNKALRLQNSRCFSLSYSTSPSCAPHQLLLIKQFSVPHKP